MQCSVPTLLPGSAFHLACIFARTHLYLSLDLFGCRAFFDSAIVMVLASALCADIRDVCSAAKAASCSCIQIYNPVCETATQVNTTLASFEYHGLQMGRQLAPAQYHASSPLSFPCDGAGHKPPGIGRGTWSGARVGIATLD